MMEESSSSKIGCAVGCGLALFFNVDLCAVAKACRGPADGKRVLPSVQMLSSTKSPCFELKEEQSG